MAGQKLWSGPHPVEPTAGRWRMSEAPDPRQAYLRPPPANDSEQTGRELQELLVLSHNRTPQDVDRILHWSVVEITPVTHWGALAEAMAGHYKLSPPAAARIHCLMDQAIYCSLVAGWRLKYRYLRPRPTELDPLIDTSVIPVPQHPSYPAGHSTVAAAAATVLSHYFPEEADQFWATAESSGLSRLLAGIHYRSDHDAGFRLGARVANELLEAAGRDRAPEAYPLNA